MEIANSHDIDCLRHCRGIHLGLGGEGDDMRGRGVHRRNVRLDVLFVGVQLTLFPFLGAGVFSQINVDDRPVEVIKRFFDSLCDDRLLRRLDQGRDVGLLRWLEEKAFDESSFIAVRLVA